MDPSRRWWEGVGSPESHLPGLYWTTSDIPAHAKLASASCTPAVRNPRETATKILETRINPGSRFDTHNWILPAAERSIAGLDRTQALSTSRWFGRVFTTIARRIVARE